MSLADNLDLLQSDIWVHEKKQSFSVYVLCADVLPGLQGEFNPSHPPELIVEPSVN